MQLPGFSVGGKATATVWSGSSVAPRANWATHFGQSPPNASPIAFAGLRSTTCARLTQLNVVAKRQIFKLSLITDNPQVRRLRRGGQHGRRIRKCQTFELQVRSSPANH